MFVLLKHTLTVVRPLLTADEGHFDFGADDGNLGAGFGVAIRALLPEAGELLAHTRLIGIAQCGSEVVSAGGEQAGVDTAGR